MYAVRATVEADYVFDGCPSWDYAAAVGTTELRLIPADQVNPEDIGTLSLRYVDRKPQLVVSGGEFIPATLTLSYLGSESTAASLFEAGAELSARSAEDLLLLDLSSLSMELETSGGLTTKHGAAIEVKPEDIGALSLHYTDNVPVTVVSGGRLVPAQVPVVDAKNRIRGVYTLAPALVESDTAPTSPTARNVTGYGAFVDLGTSDGLLHLTDISWPR
ncbi:hypothetical protein [Streptomyces sp. NPDC001415]